MSFNKKYLPKADVVFTVMFLNKQLCEKTLEAVMGERIELIDIVAECKNDLWKAALNSVYFDIKTQSVDGRIITLDLQRVYAKERTRNRTIYYACFFHLCIISLYFISNRNHAIPPFYDVLDYIIFLPRQYTFLIVK